MRGVFSDVAENSTDALLTLSPLSSDGPFTTTTPSLPSPVRDSTEGEALVPAFTPVNVQALCDVAGIEEMHSPMGEGV